MARSKAVSGVAMECFGDINLRILVIVYDDGKIECARRVDGWAKCHGCIYNTKITEKTKE